MKKLDKIYLYRDVVFRLSHQRNGIAAVECEPSEKDMEMLVEYTNLSSVWHDARKEKQPQGVCDNNAVLVVGLRNGRVAYKHLWADMEDCWKDLDLLAPPSKMVYDKVLWAYVRDLVPGAKGKGE